MNVASSGIAATLLIGYSTAHSIFKLPLHSVKSETPGCNISKISAMIKVLQQVCLIVWDECIMSHHGVFEAVNCSLRDLRGKDIIMIIMSSVVVVLAQEGGDGGGGFRQTLCVIQKCTNADELRPVSSNSICGGK